jgi:hypothetical protein
VLAELLFEFVFCAAVAEAAAAPVVAEGLVVLSATALEPSLFDAGSLFSVGADLGSPSDLIAGSEVGLLPPRKSVTYHPVPLS